MRRDNRYINKRESCKRSVIDNKIYNRGSATIEMAVVMSVVLLIVYLYITLFLFYSSCAKDLSTMVESLYPQMEQRENSDGEKFQIQTTADRVTVYSFVTMQSISKRLELHRYNDSPIDNIRRWQLATDTILQGGAS